MEETEAYTAVSGTGDADSVGDNGASGAGDVHVSAAGALLMGLLAMALIYVLLILLPRIAAAADKLLGRTAPKERPPESSFDEAGGYRVYDIYEGEECLENNNDDKENHNG